MEWGQFEPKKWTEDDVDIQISHCGICGSDLHMLSSGWGPTPYRKSCSWSLAIDQANKAQLALLATRSSARLSRLVATSSTSSRVTVSVSERKHALANSQTAMNAPTACKTTAPAETLVPTAPSTLVMRASPTEDTPHTTAPTETLSSRFLRV